MTNFFKVIGEYRPFFLHSCIFLFLVALLISSPAITLFLTGLILAIQNKSRDIVLIQSYSLIFVIFGLSLMMTTEPTLKFFEQDFFLYYKNYLDFLYDVNQDEKFRWGGGFEVGVPILNLIYSKIIGGPYPFILKFLHALNIVILMCAVVIFFQRHFNINQKYFFLVLISFIIFFKFGSAFNALRQTYATLFLLLSVFAYTKGTKLLFFIIATLFHISSIFLLPIVIFFMKRRSLKSYTILFIAPLLIALFILLNSNWIVNLFLTQSFLFSDQLSFFFARSFLNEAEEFSTSSYLTTIATRFIYFIPLLFGSLFISAATKSLNYGLFCLILLYLVSITFFVPGLVIRIFHVFFVISLGLIYFLAFQKDANFTLYNHFACILWIIVFLNWSSNDFFFFELNYFGNDLNTYFELFSTEMPFSYREGAPFLDIWNGK